MGEDPRKYQRLKWDRQGEISSLLGQKIIACLVQDISQNGARLKVATPEVVPDYFRLNYGASEEPKCCVRWRKGDEMGVMFLLNREAGLS